VSNHALKEFFSYPRPFDLDPSLGLIHVSGYGLPSGAAQSVILLGGLLLSCWKSYWSWCIAFVYITSVSFSRIYLGLHFPSDILAGWGVGFLLWTFFIYGLPHVEERLSQFQPKTLFWMGLLLPFSLLFLPWQQAGQVVRITSVAMGMCLGLFINHLCRLSLQLPQSRAEYLLRSVPVVAGTFLFFALTSVISFENAFLTLFCRFFLAGLWVSLGCTLLCRAIGLISL